MKTQALKHRSYDIVIIGGAMMGASAAWFLSDDADFAKNLPRYMGNDARVPQLSIRAFGYMYMADNAGFADVLRESQQVQLEAGAATKLMTPKQIKEAYPFYNVDDIVLGSINLVDQGI